MLTPLEPPPEDYYRNNCVELLTFVLRRYRHLLPEYERCRVADLLASNDDCQRLFARLLARKGSLFKVDSLNYTEVSDLDEALSCLQSISLVRVGADVRVPADRLLHKLTKQELYDLGLVPLRKSWPKDLMQAVLLSDRTDDQVRAHILAKVPFVQVCQPHLWHKMLYLYFGDRLQDWSTFVRRDLGQIRFAELNCVPRFSSQQGLEEALGYGFMSGLSRRLAEHPGLAPELVRALQEAPTDRWLQPRRERVLSRVAQFLERDKQLPEALDCYKYIKVHPARERMVRIHTKLGNVAAANALLDVMSRSPWCEEETQFVRRFGKRGEGFQPKTITRHLAARGDGSIEQAASELLVSSGEALWCIHTENSLLRTLTGLMYWPVIFAELPGAFTNPFQTAPNDLYMADFCGVRAPRLDELEHKLLDDNKLCVHLLSVAENQAGIANNLVSWRLLQIFPLQEMFAHIPLQHMRRMCGFLIRNLWQLGAGMPDLFVVWRSGGYGFVEVKGPGDQLRAAQRIWFAHLKRMNVPAVVLRLRVDS